MFFFVQNVACLEKNAPNYFFQYGTLEPLGTVDFYPGAKGHYGCYQPGCYDGIFNIISCSHSRSRMMFESSITDAICIADRECQGDPKKFPANCKNILTFEKKKDPEVVTMGYWWDTKHPRPGMYTVEVGYSAPFCK